MDSTNDESKFIITIKCNTKGIYQNSLNQHSVLIYTYKYLLLYNEIGIGKNFITSFFQWNDK